MASTEERLATLERQIRELAEIVALRGQEIDRQGQEIERLRGELSWEITERAVERLPGAGRYVLVSR